ncbi:MAG: site-specific integrase [Alphaproteobacteria bacterium]|nr:site-specific integrase [Alphaproteobacteria bacterium]
MGKEDVAWSLKTGDLREARKRLPAMQVRFEAVVSPPDPRREDLERRYGVPATLPAPEMLQRLQAVIAAGQAADAARDRQQAAQVDPADFGLDVDRPEPPAATERDRLEALHGHRLDDPAFRAAATAAGLVPERVIAAEDVAAELAEPAIKPAAPTDNSLDDLRRRWEGERKPSRKTADETASTIAMFTTVAGVKPVGDHVKKDVIAYKDWLLTQPGRMSETLSAVSVVKRLNLLKAVFGYGVDNDVVQVNPATGVTIKVANNSDQQPFSRADLDILFAPQNLPKNKNYQIIMLIGLYSGARLNEICQLRGSDVVQEDGVWCMGIDDAGDDQSVKIAGSRRLVPIHPVLIDAGFVDLATKHGAAQLFADLIWKETQGWSKKASKDINRHIRKLIPDARKVFHSFRHSVKDLCRDPGSAEDIHDGTLFGERWPGYGAGHSIRRLAEELGRIEGRWRLP